MIKGKQKYIDISLPIKNGMTIWPQDPKVDISRVSNIECGDECNVSQIKMGTHIGTHIDAPLHYFNNAKGIDKVSLESLIGIARVINIRSNKNISIDEIKKYKIHKGERILFKTANSKYTKMQRDVFNKNYVYVPEETAEYLAVRKIQTIGIDSLSVADYQNGTKTHKILLKAGICIIEGLDLSKVKEGNYMLYCLPLNIIDSDGAPARAVLFPMDCKKRK